MSGWEEFKEILCCPKCKGSLVFNDGTILCSLCRQEYEISDDIPLLFWPNEWGNSKEDITDIEKAFYEENPFPNYDDVDDVNSLMFEAKKGIFAKLLDEQIPFGTRILEAGCGTGQLSNFLSIANRNVFATDMCINSLKLAKQFKEENALTRAHFMQMNLFRPSFKAETFDLVICNGVLHHTSDPFSGFKSIASLVKPNGYILIGLYHKYGRLLTDMGRVIFNLWGAKRFNWLPFHKKEIQKAKRNIWLLDQYKNPHESKHIISEVSDWLKQANFKFIKSLPKAGLFGSFSENDNLFSPDLMPGRLELFFAERAMVFTGSKNGGLFMIIGRRDADQISKIN